MTSTWKIELIPVPVTDVDRAKAFYQRIGFTADHDHQVHDGLRFLQLTPPGPADLRLTGGLPARSALPVRDIGEVAVRHVLQRSSFVAELVR
ncbi:hypothetical protein [Micromonospora cremea]|uniref:Glyoxalase-like domain-containing protein n=1 Tax=Micromonospora cremea TaxID=709881 RepID=A0A1N6BDX4_9ACTN|nr:hypothetical protein [Micromonospora cremea]SIN44432.1 hypothetical protein SAMN04489832_7251 [Micromonospora cremea]